MTASVDISGIPWPAQTDFTRQTGYETDQVIRSYFFSQIKLVPTSVFL